MDNSDRERFEEALKRDKFSYNEKFKGFAPNKKRNGNAEKRVDLHKATRERAEEIIVTALKSNAYSKTAKIVLICGRGIHSEGEPVLRRHAEEVLLKMKEYYEKYSVDLNNNITVYLRER
ncbi:MAG: hypothetical protein AB7T10_07775 [bacterium]